MWLVYRDDDINAKYDQPWQRVEAFRKLLKATHQDVAGKFQPVEGTGILDIKAVLEADLPDLYRASDLFVLCTREDMTDRAVEGFGLVLLEAQSCAVPVLSTRTGGIPDAVDEANGGWLIDDGDVSATTQVLRDLLGRPEAYRRAGQRARVRVERAFTWDHTWGA